MVSLFIKEDRRDYFKAMELVMKRNAEF